MTFQTQSVHEAKSHLLHFSAPLVFFCTLIVSGDQTFTQTWTQSEDGHYYVAFEWSAPPRPDQNASLFMW